VDGVDDGRHSVWDGLIKESHVTVHKMGIVEVARDALKEIPLSEVLRERVSLALDRLAEAERKIETLQMENGGLKSQLERERVDNEQTKKELQRLKEQLREDIRVVH
jgi:predicted RNase H-like nuclease (RuvC/YqgF family)